MSKHTPGPWIACKHGDYGDYDGNCIVILGEGGDIRTAVVLGFDSEENRANASLISAAPDLLEALKRIMDVDCPLTGDPSHQELVEHWEYEKSQGRGEAEDRLFALYAISKATGAA